MRLRPSLSCTACAATTRSTLTALQKWWVGAGVGWRQGREGGGPWGAAAREWDRKHGQHLQLPCFPPTRALSMRHVSEAHHPVLLWLTKSGSLGRNHVVQGGALPSHSAWVQPVRVDPWPHAVPHHGCRLASPPGTTRTTPRASQWRCTATSGAPASKAACALVHAVRPRPAVHHALTHHSKGAPALERTPRLVVYLHTVLAHALRRSALAVQSCCRAGNWCARAATLWSPCRARTSTRCAACWPSPAPGAARTPCASRSCCMMMTRWVWGLPGG